MQKRKRSQKKLCLKFPLLQPAEGWVGLLFFFLSSFSVFSQSSTRSQSNDLAKTNKEIAAQHKVMIVPFEPKLFLCEIGKNISKETNMGFDQIRNTFRSGLEFSLLMDLKPTFSAISLLADSNLTCKDMNYIYESVGYSYDVIPQETHPGKNTAVKKEVKEPGIQNGQVVVKLNEDKRFMNAKITNKELLSYLHKKYETDIFVFVNQLDITNVVAESFDINSNGFDREITIHYTIFDQAGKQLNAGVTTSRFSSRLNEPKKIIKDHVSAATSKISARLVNILMPPKPEENKAK